MPARGLKRCVSDTNLCAGLWTCRNWDCGMLLGPMDFSEDEGCRVCPRCGTMMSDSFGRLLNHQSFFTLSYTGLRFGIPLSSRTGGIPNRKDGVVSRR